MDPAVGEQEWIAVEHPKEIHAVVDLPREFCNGGVIRKVLRRGQDAGEDEGCVNRRHFTVPFALACGDIHPVKEPAVLLGGFESEELQGGANTGLGEGARDPTVFGADANGGESEASGGEAGDVTARAFGAATVGASAVENQAGGGVAFVPEIQDAAAFQVFEQKAILGCNGWLR